MCEQCGCSEANNELESEKTFKDQVKETIEAIRPSLQAHGGDVELVPLPAVIAEVHGHGGRAAVVDVLADPVRRLEDGLAGERGRAGQGCGSRLGRSGRWGWGEGGRGSRVRFFDHRGGDRAGGVEGAAQVGAGLDVTPVQTVLHRRDLVEQQPYYE